MINYEFDDFKMSLICKCYPNQDFSFKPETPFSDIKLLDIKTRNTLEDGVVQLVGKLHLRLKSQGADNTSLLLKCSVNVVTKGEAIEGFIKLLEYLFNFPLQYKDERGEIPAYCRDFIIPDFPYSKEFFGLDSQDHIYQMPKLKSHVKDQKRI